MDFRSHIRLLTDPLLLKENPFVIRGNSRDLNKGQPYKSFAWVTLILGLCFIGGYALNVYLHRRHLGVSAFLGGSPGIMICMFLCIPHVWFISASANKHTFQLFIKEGRQQTLESLITLPTPAIQFLIQPGIYGWLAAMRVALVGLPFYVATMFFGGVTFWDILWMYLVFATVAFSIPAVTEPMRSGRDFSKPVIPTIGGAQQMQAVNNRQMGQQNQSPISWVQIILFQVLAQSFGRKAQLVMKVATQYLPKSIVYILPIGLLAWPFVIGRALRTPFVWFNMSMLPIVGIAISVVAGRYLTLLARAELLRIGKYRDLIYEPTYFTRRKLLVLLNGFRIVFWSGFLWQWLIMDGALSTLLASARQNTEFGFKGLTFGAMFIASFMVSYRATLVADWYSPNQREKGMLVERILVPERLFLWVFKPMGLGIGFLLLTSAISRTMIDPGGWLQFMGRLSVMIICNAVLSFTIARRAKWLSYLGLPIFLGVFMLPAKLAGLAIFSPFLGFAQFGNLAYFEDMFRMVGVPPAFSALVTHTTPWYFWPATMLATAALVRLSFVAKERPKYVRDSMEETVQVDPTAVGLEVYKDPHVRTDEAKAEEKERTESPLGKKMATFVLKFTDNALSIKEVRAKLRGLLPGNSLRTMLIVCAMISLMPFFFPAVSYGTGLSISGWLLPQAIEGQGAVAFGMICYWYGLIIYLSLSSSFIAQATAFMVDKQKSTLGFVLLTPMSNFQIAYGKAFGVYMVTGLMTGIGLAWTLMLSVLTIPIAGIGPLLVWCMFAALITVMTLGASSLGIALATLTARTKKANPMLSIFIAVAFVSIAVISIIIAGLNGLGSTMANIVTQPFSLATSLVVLSLTAILIGHPLLIWGMYRLRKGDIAFEQNASS